MLELKKDYLIKEFERQVKNLLLKGYPKLAGITEKVFLQYLEQLRTVIETHNEIITYGNIPFLIIIKSEIVSTSSAISLVQVGKAQGIINMTPVEPKDFYPTKNVQIPKGLVYLAIDIDTGRETLNIRPEDALKIILSKKRSPLTIDEGIALITQFPEVLSDKKNYNSFQMLGSRRDDQRVPSIWMSYGKPRLGWCWDRNPHTWLGSASCVIRE